jgi:hypothetical protein
VSLVFLDKADNSLGRLYFNLDVGELPRLLLNVQLKIIWWTVFLGKFLFEVTSSYMVSIIRPKWSDIGAITSAATPNCRKELICINEFFYSGEELPFSVSWSSAQQLDMEIFRKIIQPR